MRITVITVCYNSAATLADALQSVAMQAGVEVEHIVIDGASTDGTTEVIGQFQQHLASVVSEPDAGIYDAMNKGLALATGELVGFLNADDMLAAPDVLARVAAAALAAPQADAVYGDLEYVTQGTPSRVVRYWQSGAFEPSRLKFGWMPPHPTLYVRRAVLERMRGFDTTYRIAADYDFMLRLLTRAGCQVAYLPQVLVFMRTGGASNRSLKALWRKSSEDFRALRSHRVGGLLSLAAKNLRKIPQFLGGR